MNPIEERIKKLQESMRGKGLDEQSEELEEVKQLTRDDVEEYEEGQRPLYNAQPTGVPGTWSEPDGDLIKTSKD